MIAAAGATKAFGPLAVVLAGISAYNKIGQLNEEAKAKHMTPGQLLIQREKEQQQRNQGKTFVNGLIGDVVDWFHKAINQQITIPKNLSSGAVTPEQKAVSDSMKEAALNTEKAAEQHAQSARKITNSNLPKVVSDQFSDTVNKLNDMSFAQKVADAMLAALQRMGMTSSDSEGIQRPGNPLGVKPRFSGKRNRVK